MHNQVKIDPAYDVDLYKDGLEKVLGDPWQQVTKRVQRNEYLGLTNLLFMKGNFLDIENFS